MSFDLFLQGFDSGNLANLDRTKVLEVLRRHSSSFPNKFGFYNVQFADDSDVEFSAKELESDGDFTCCAFHIHGFSPAILSFIYDVAQAGNMVIFNPQGDDTESNPSAILTNMTQTLELPSEFLKFPVLCNSAQHLSVLLGLAFDNWQNYRDSVVGQSS